MGELNPKMRKKVSEKVTTIIDNKHENVMPTVAVTNVRSLEPKLKSVISEMKVSSIDLLFVSETWEKQQQVSFDEVIERMNEIDGISYISTGPRPNLKRGGGAAVLSNPSRVSVKRLEIF